MAYMDGKIIASKMEQKSQIPMSLEDGSHQRETGGFQKNGAFRR